MLHRILLVEDDLDTLHGLKQYLEKEGFLVDIVDNGKDALNFVLEGGYSAIVTDINMPYLDGLNFLNKLAEENIDIPVVVITAYSNLENMITAFDLGAVEFIEKPFDPDDLVKLLRKVLYERV